MSAKSDIAFFKGKDIYLEWVNEKYGITESEIINEFTNSLLGESSLLSTQELLVLELKLGLNTGLDMGVKEIGTRLKCSHSKVSRILRDAYIKIASKKEILNKI